MNDAYGPALLELSLIAHKCQYGMRRQPLLGGAFASGAFEMTSMLLTEGPLYAIDYFVMHRSSGAVIGIGSTKPVALEMARRLLKDNRATLDWLFIEAAAKAREWDEAVAQMRVEQLPSQPKKVVSVPKRRLEIFQKSAGKCHYCSTVLSLDGKWHIEHKMPRALLGGNKPSNLVASCVPCNMKKRDRTDVEFETGMKADIA